MISVSRAGGPVEQVLKGSFAAAALSPDGKAMILWLLQAEGGGKAAKLWISSPPGAPIRKYEPVTFEAEGSFTPVTLRFAPDGHSVLLAVPSGSGIELWLLPFPGGAKPTRLLEKALAGADSLSMSWMPDSRHFVLAFSSRANPQSQLWMADTGKDSLVALTAGERGRYNPAVSPDGRKIAFDSRTLNFDVVELPIAGGAVKPLISTSRDETFPAWSSNGQLAYATNRNGGVEIWLKSLQENWERPVVTERDFADDPSLGYSYLALSPDGARLAYVRNSARQTGKIWISPTGGGAPIRLTKGEGYEMEPGWSPDGAWIVYFSTETGLMKARVGSSEPPMKLDHDHCRNAPQWSPDGRWIACAGEKGIDLLSPDGKQKRTVGNQSVYIVWSRDGKELYALGRADQGHWKIATIDPVTGNGKLLADFGADLALASPVSPGFPLSLSPDGKSLATSVLSFKSDIWLLEGFQ